MYTVDEKDQVVELTGVPQSSTGAPIPFIMNDEHQLVLAYYIQETPDGWDGSSVRVVGPDTDGEPVAILRFDASAHMFGPPNDEAFQGHPLAGRGLQPYGAYEIKNSSWIRQLARMNSVHPHHRPERFKELRHLIFAFHDSTFECVCRKFDVQVSRGSIKSIIPEMQKLFRW